MDTPPASPPGPTQTLSASYEPPPTRLSVNLNKVALLRNSRGGARPDLLTVALDCERFGAEGITLHPRPDERHARLSDLPKLKTSVITELNIEGYPTEPWMAAVLACRPAQATLVPDPPDALTSSQGWDTARHGGFLSEVCARLTAAGIRPSIFVDAHPAQVAGAAAVGAARVELYTGPYAAHYLNRGGQAALAPYLEAAAEAWHLGLGLNAGHDLDLDNLAYLRAHLPGLLEVSIGHALICDALYLGLENTVRMYRERLSGPGAPPPPPRGV